MPRFAPQNGAAMETRPAKLALVGGGNMARAILMGALDSGVAEPWEVIVADPMAPQRAVLERVGIRCAERAPDLARWMNGDTQLMLAVKPQMLEAAAADTRPLLETSRVVISILAGTPTEKVRAALGDNARMVRAMPNTPARVRRGMAAIALGAGAHDDDDDLAVRLFKAVGDVVRIEEPMMDAFTAVVGSGPAYIFYLAEAMVEAAEELGFDAATADRIVRNTIRGAGALMCELLDSTATELREAVTSKGGTTAAALGVLDDNQVNAAVIKAITAARNRGVELAKG
ncbi:MAG: pyrroline-5-carboxylate reductase [Phycisphaerales bacterium]